MPVSSVLKAAVDGYVVSSVAAVSGIPQSGLQRFVSGETDLSLQNVDKLAEYFDLELVQEIDFAEYGQEKWDEQCGEWWGEHETEAWREYKADNWPQYESEHWAEYEKDAWQEALADDWEEDDYDEWEGQVRPEWSEELYGEWREEEYEEWYQTEYAAWEPGARLVSDAELYAELSAKDYVRILDDEEIAEEIKEAAANQ